MPLATPRLTSTRLHIGAAEFLPELQFIRPSNSRSAVHFDQIIPYAPSATTITGFVGGNELKDFLLLRDGEVTFHSRLSQQSNRKCLANWRQSLQDGFDCSFDDGTSDAAHASPSNAAYSTSSHAQRHKEPQYRPSTSRCSSERKVVGAGKMAKQGIQCRKTC